METEPQDRIPKSEHPALIRRALAAYYADPYERGWPDPEACGVVTRRGLPYVCLCSPTFETLAVYRVRRVPGTTRPSQLKRLKRPPAGLG